MVNPLLDPNISLNDLFEGYIEAYKDLTRIRSKFVMYDDHKKRNLKKEEKTEATGWFDIKYKRGSNNKELDKE